MQIALLPVKRWLVILILWSALPVYGQFQYEWLTTSNGLSQGFIYDILQDQDGFMWFGTKDGLNRYDGYSFKVYTHDSYNSNSISNNTINHILEDSKGRLWITTDDGINIYDKRNDSFRKILNDPEDKNSISGNKIELPVIELGEGRFLVFPHEKNLEIISLPDDFIESNKPPSITHLFAPELRNPDYIFKDGNGKIYLVSEDKLYEFLPDEMQIKLRKKDMHFNQSSLNADGSLWLNDVFFSQMKDTILYPLFTKTITHGHGNFFMYEEDKKRLWVGITDIGNLQIYDIKNWKRGAPLDPDNCKIQDEFGITVTKFYTDRSGIIWVGTNGYGIRKYSTNAEKFAQFASGMSIRKIEACQNNEFYLKGWHEVRRYDLNGNNITTSKDQELHFQQDFMVGKDNSIWFLHGKKDEKNNRVNEVLENYDPVTKTSKDYSFTLDISQELIESKMEDSHGNIWICGAGGTMLVLQPETGQHKIISINTDLTNPMLKSAEITALYEDEKNIYWAGTETGLVKLMYDPSSDAQPKIKWYKTNPNDETGLSYAHVLSIVNDPFDKNILWVATKGGGINRLDKTKNQFSHITTTDGLCNNVVYGLLVDDAGNIWGSTNKGIFCMTAISKNNVVNYSFRNFTKTAGLQHDEFNTGAFKKLSNGNLAFGGVNGVNIFNPAVVLQSEFTPKVFITNILVGNKIVTPDNKIISTQKSNNKNQSLTLDYWQDILTLEFSSLDFTAPNQNKYRYQMVGMDKTWVESGTRRSVTYLRLPAGNYTFKVQGSNSQGVWSDHIAELNIIVKPPLWFTWWAYLIYAILIAIGVRAYFRFRINKAKLESQLNFEQQEAKRVKELDSIKTQLYANITHEFRTPLTVILGMANQVKNNPEKHLETGVDMIVRNGENLLTLVNEMLDLSKLEDGKMALHLTNGDIISFLRYMVESFQSLAAGQLKQFHFLSEIDELHVAFDAEKIRQIISNLLSNALKFTAAHGNIYVSISQEKDLINDLSIVILKVKDTGIGIPENQVEYIFDRFYQLDNSQTRKTGGTGIGLALTKELVKLMNGSIHVKSPPVGAVKGTEFTVTIPLTRASIAEEKTVILQQVSKDENTSSTKIKSTNGYLINSEIDDANQPLILLVEDNADVVAYTASCLPDYKLSVGQDGAEGFDIAVNIIPDLIISDVMMPFVDGFEMCRKLRLDERTSHIPIIMLTAKADLKSKLEGIEKGADIYLEKPFHKEELLLRIKKLLEQRKHLQQYYSRQIGILQNGDTSAIPETKTISEEKTEHVFVKKVREIVEANFNNHEFNVEQLCRNIFMSHSQLHRKLEALTGCSPNKFIRIVRLTKAKELLADDSLSIAAIALACGYSDAGYFARVFKQETGFTPQEWRGRKEEGERRKEG